MDQRALYVAKKYHLEDKVEALEKALLKVEGAVEIEFDLDGFLDNINQVIFTVKYEIPSIEFESYYQKRRELISSIIQICTEHDLVKTEDTIEDYGAHFYFVFRCKKSWRQEE